MNRLRVRSVLGLGRPLVALVAASGSVAAAVGACAPDAVLEVVAEGGAGASSQAGSGGAPGGAPAGGLGGVHAGGVGGVHEGGSAAGHGGGSLPDLAPGELGWRDTWGDSDTQRITAVDVAPNGDIVVAGLFSGDLDIVSPALVGGATGDLFVARLTETGEPLWAHAFGGAGLDWPFDLVVDDAGDIVLVGATTSATLQLGLSSVTADGIAATEWPFGEMFIVKLTSLGIPTWVVDPVGAGRRLPQTVAIDGDLIVVAGLFTGTTNLGSEPDTEMVAAPAAERAFVAALDASGTPTWSLALPAVAGSIAPNHSWGIATIAPQGDVVCSFAFSGNTTLGGLTAGTLGVDFAVLGLTRDEGSEQWFIRSGGAGEKLVEALSVADDGVLTMVGRFVGDLVLGAEVHSSFAPDDMDGFVARHALPPLNHTPSDFVVYSGAGMQAPTALVVGDQRIAVALDFKEAVTIGDDDYNAQGTDTLIVALDGSLSAQHVTHIGGSGDEERAALALLSTGDLVVGGSFNGSLELNGAGVANSLADSLDAFLLTLGL